MQIIIGRNGNQKTPIADPTVSREHCKVTDNGDGTYILENLSQYGTKVNGVSVIRTTVNPESRIQLGGTFSATLRELIGLPRNPEGSARKISYAAPHETVKSYNISHLRKVWEDYNNVNLEMAEAQRKTNLLRTVFGIFTMCAMPTIFFFGPVGYALTALGVIGNIYSFTGMKNAETPEERQRRQDAFDDAWVCPNPDCGHSLLAKNYRMLVRNHQSCPYCKCKYVER